MSQTIAGIAVPDSSLARAATELVRDTESDLLYHHSRRVFLFGALTGRRRELAFDAELLYVGAMFHDMGLVPAHASATERFEVDGANAARDFLASWNIAEPDIEQVWDAIALHTTPGIPKHKKPVVALVTAGVEMDVLGLAYDEFTRDERELVVAAHPRETNFKEAIVDAFAEGTRRKPETTFGNVKADVLALKDPSYRRLNFCSIILGSAWNDHERVGGCAACAA
ncbi:MAG TPA: HD domain-containing protein [Burkholderiaceae bacterium]